jgi:2-polyprenyl-6-hydroxyphenyl methylase/3-demethylubiquinone-9 3-methyltransferase
LLPADNRIYDQLADTWWDEAGQLHILAGLVPARFGYIRRVLRTELRLDPRDLRTLDMGCGGGLLTEEFARLGCAVTGIDPSFRSLSVARAHAAAGGLRIEYCRAAGEALPFPDGSFALVYCCDVLEHVGDLMRVIAETARVLAPGGVYFYDTLNRTWQSKLVAIKLLQEWGWTSLLSPDLHDWRQFIRPAELLALLTAHGLENRGLTGLKPRANPLSALRTLRARKRGQVSYVEAMRRLGVGESRDVSLLYMGYALKPCSPSPAAKDTGDLAQ